MSQLAHALDARSALDTARFPSDARLALRLLERMRHGRLDVTFPDGQHAYYGDLRSAERADLTLHDWSVVRAALRSGDIGFAESYIAGDWSTHDLVRLLEFFVVNRDAAEDAIYGSFIGRLTYRVRHLLNRNTKAQAKKNIHAHYDLGNDTGFPARYLREPSGKGEGGAVLICEPPMLKPGEGAPPSANRPGEGTPGSCARVPRLTAE